MGTPAGFGAPDLPAEVVRQLKGMSPSEAQALAQRYGLNPADYVDTPAPAAPGQAPLPAPAAPPPAPPPPPPPKASSEVLEVATSTEAAAAETAADSTIEPLAPEKRYGLGFFTSSMARGPTDNAPVPPDYRLGVGDEVVLFLVGLESREIKVTIDRHGEIALPDLGKLSLAGTRFDDAVALLQAKFANSRIGVEAFVTLGRLRMINVTFAGEVANPGTTTVPGLTRLSQALYAAGGLTGLGSLRHIAVNRGAETTLEFDAYELLLKGDATKDVALQDGDVVFVPPVKRMAAVFGAARRPGIYELLPHSRLSDLLAMAGGPTERALSEQVLLEHEIPGGVPEIQSITLTALPLRQAAPGDRLRLLPRASRFANRVTLRGAVQRPGVYGWEPKMTVADFLRDPNRDLLENTDYSYALRVSTRFHDGYISVQTFSPVGTLGGSFAPALMPRDEILILPRPGTPARRNLIDQVISRLRAQATPDEPAQLVTIEGPVREPGAYPHEPGLSIPALVRAAGGFREAAIDLDFGLVLSQDPVTGVLTFRQFAPRELLRSTATAALKLALKPGDSVILLPNVSGEPDTLATRQARIKGVVRRLQAQATPERPAALASISGAVFAPGTYPLSTDSTVQDLVAAAGGLKEGAYERSVEIRSVAIDDRGDAFTETRTVSLTDGTVASATLLRAKDQVLIKTIPGLNSQSTVELSGEIRFPGVYPIAPGEKLSEVLARAGGLTENAYPYGAVFTSETQAAVERSQLNRFSDELRRTFAAQALTLETPGSNLSELEQTLAALTEREAAGRIAVNFPGLLLGDRSADLEVSDGDRLYVPGRSNAIAVLGEVFRPGNFQFSDSLNLEDYLALSAGITKRADRRKLYVVRADGSVFRPQRSLLAFELGRQKLRPGDAIVVPVDTAYRDTLSFWSTITQIAFQTGVSLTALRQFN